MCLGVPGRLLEVTADGATALVDIGGTRQPISLALLVDDPPAVGDWLAVHMGFALARLTEAEARDALDALVVIGPGEDAMDGSAVFAAWGMT